MESIYKLKRRFCLFHFLLLSCEISWPFEGDANIAYRASLHIVTNNSFAPFITRSRIVSIALRRSSKKGTANF